MSLVLGIASVVDLAEDERSDLLVFLEGLERDQWDAATLCGEWSVRDVVAHVVSYEELPTRQIAALFARHRMSFARANAVALDDLTGLEPPALLDRLRRNLRPTGVSTAFAGRIALTDCLIHHQDIRRGLGIQREVPAERLLAVLRFLPFALPLPARRHMRGLRLAATDLAWSRGSGPLVSGPGEALVMAVAGRAAALDDLSGPGLSILVQRVTQQ